MVIIKQRLFLDFDSTIVNSIKAYCDTYEYYYAGIPGYKKPNPDKVEKWDLSDECPLAKNNVENLFGNYYFFEILDFMPNAKEVIEELVKKYEVYIVTIGTINNLVFKARWIEKSLPFVKNIILIKNEGIHMNKSMINMLGGIFIDDVESNLRSSNASVKYCFGKVYEWNKNWDLHRLLDWNEVKEILL